MCCSSRLVTKHESSTSLLKGNLCRGIECRIQRHFELRDGTQYEAAFEGLFGKEPVTLKKNHNLLFLSDKKLKRRLRYGEKSNDRRKG
jgi:hypothetical protein